MQGRGQSEIIRGGQSRTTADVLNYILIFGLCLLGGGLLVALELFSVLSLSGDPG